MESYKTPESPENSGKPLKGLGQKLKLHIIIPIINAVVLIAMFIQTCVKNG